MTVVGMTGLAGKRFAALCDVALVTPSPSTPRRAGGPHRHGPRAVRPGRARAVPGAAQGRPPVIRALFEELRPRQWTKNLLLFAGVIFSRQAGQARRCCCGRPAGFVAFSLLAGTVYLLNDLRDVEQDRLHPKKRQPPDRRGPALRAGRVGGRDRAARRRRRRSRRGSVRTSRSWPRRYLVMNVVYSLWLRDQVLLDVFFIAFGFVLRAIAGVELLRPVAPATELSPWLLVCTFFGALFLALAKRRRELTNAGEEAGRQRTVLAALQRPRCSTGCWCVSAAASIMGYALYTIWPATVAKFGTEALLYTVPFVTYGVFRYLYLVRASDDGGGSLARAAHRPAADRLRCSPTSWSRSSSSTRTDEPPAPGPGHGARQAQPRAGGRAPPARRLPRAGHRVPVGLAGRHAGGRAAARAASASRCATRRRPTAARCRRAPARRCRRGPATWPCGRRGWRPGMPG